MTTRRIRTALGAATLALALVPALVGCSSDDDAPTLSVDAVPDFSLADVNPSSPTHGTSVTVRDHLDSVSAWYFAHAT